MCPIRTDGPIERPEFEDPEAPPNSPDPDEGEGLEEEGAAEGEDPGASGGSAEGEGEKDAAAPGKVEPDSVGGDGEKPPADDTADKRVSDAQRKMHDATTELAKADEWFKTNVGLTFKQLQEREQQLADEEAKEQETATEYVTRDEMEASERRRGERERIGRALDTAYEKWLSEPENKDLFAHREEFEEVMLMRTSKGEHPHKRMLDAAKTFRERVARHRAVAQNDVKRTRKKIADASTGGGPGAERPVPADEYAEQAPGEYMASRQQWRRRRIG